MAAHRNIRFAEIARILQVHPQTLRRYRRHHGIEKPYSAISNRELDVLVRSFKTHKPESGFRYLTGFLREQGIYIQRQRVWQSLHRVDRLNWHLRQGNQVIQRRRYKVKRANALWHVDGHHKLIRWGFVIHGFIDGYCRTVCMLVHWNYSAWII